METDQTKAAFFLGMGIMGVLAGFGFGSKSPNKLALLVGAGSLFLANRYHPMIDISPRPELQESAEETISQARARAEEEIRRRVPFTS